MLSSLISFGQSLNQTIVDVNANPPTLRIKGSIPEFDLSKMVFTVEPINDAANTQIVNLRFKGCPDNNNLRFYDTTFAIPAIFPFDLRIYSIYDTSTICSYPPEPFVLDSVYFTADQILTTEEALVSSTNFSVYPNPTTGLLQLITRDAANVREVIVFDMLGREMLRQSNYSETLHLQHLPKGVYYLTVYLKEGIVTEKLVLE